MPTIFRHRVDIGALTANLGLVDGVQLGVDILDGWRSTPQVDAQLNPRGAADGAYGSPKWTSQERYLTVGGWYNAFGDNLAAEKMHDRIVNAFSTSEFNLSRWEAVPKSLEVRHYGQVEFFDEMEDASRWIATVVAPYPFKVSLDSVSLQTYGYQGGEFYRTYPRIYSDPYPNRTYQQVAGASATNPMVFNNVGTAPSLPTIDIHGPLEAGSWFLVNETTGEQMWAYTSLRDGQVLSIDTRRMKAMQDGYDVSHLVFGDWFGLVPGENTIRLYGATEAYAEIREARSAWK